MEGEDWDALAVANHVVKCQDCNRFQLALKRGELVEEEKVDQQEEARLRQEGYCSREEWEQRMKEFGEATRGKKDPFDSMSRNG